MGPAWLAMGIYLTLKHVVKAYGRQYSYLRPKYYTWFFIGGNCFSLSLQAASGGLASGAEGKPNQMTVGNNLAIAGIILQVVTLVIFADLAALFFGRRHLALRTSHAEKSDSQVPQIVRFKFFLAAVTIAFITIFIGSVCRIAERMGGWGNPLMQNEGELIALDSVMCVTAALVLTIFHPGLCFPHMVQSISFGKGKVLSIREYQPIGKTTRKSASASELDLDVE